MNSNGDAQLVELIYDAAFDPDLWVPVMEEVTRRVAGEAACMTMLDVHSGDGSGATAFVPGDVMADYFARWAHDNPLHEVSDALAYVENWRPATIQYEEWIERGQLERSGFFNEFLQPIGADHGMMLGLALVGTSTVTMNIARPTRRGAFSDDEVALTRRWSAHLSRAVRLGQAVQVSHAALNAVDQLVASTPHCLFFLDARCRVRRLSTAAEAVLREGNGLYVADGLLTSRDPDEACELQRLVARAAGDGGAGTMRVRVRGGDPQQLQIAPLGPRASAAWSAEPAVMVTVTKAPPPALPIDLRLRQRFGFTPAEARLALALMRGGTLRETADHAAVSVNTVRAQLGHIFSKTGWRRQADLVRELLLFEEGEPGA